jgi:drug/metabolite transporter (DMT)-like permease
VTRDNSTEIALKQPTALGWAVVGVVVSVFALTLQDAIMKGLSGAYPLHQVVFGRSLVAIVLILIATRLTNGLSILRTRRLRQHLTRGLLLIVANSAYFLALAAMPLAQTMSIFFVAPVLITLLSFLLLGEKVDPRRWLAVLLGLAGVVVMLRPGTAVFELVALLPIAAALAYALMQVMTRQLGVTEHALTMAFYIQLCFIAAGMVAGLAVGDGKFAGGGHVSLEFLFRAWVWPSPLDAALIAAMGTLIAIVSYALSQAYRLAPASAISPFEYVALPLAVMWGFVFWGDLPDALSSLGIAMIIASGVITVSRGDRRGQGRAASQRPPDQR